MAVNRVKRIAIVCGYPFPDGLAPTTRILTYSKGLVENGVKTDIFIYFPTESKPASLPVNGEINGINYYYPKTRKYPSNKIVRIFSHAFYCWVSVTKFLKENKTEKFDFVIMSTDWFRILYVFIPIIRLAGSRSIFIADEYPVPIRLYLKDRIPKWKKLLFKNVLRHVSGMIFMTDNLSEFYNEIVRKPSFILPTITDISRFLEISKNNTSSKNICYMGNMEMSKDNVDNIIEAFKIISNKYNGLELHLYGAPSTGDLKKINDLIVKLELQNKVILKGRVSNAKVPALLSDSYILVSSQPATKRAEGGFPTKLGEYMASGTPTLLTNVGEIGKYVSDGVNCWLAVPNDPVNYAEKLEYIINNYDQALEVAERAKGYILDNFDYKIQCLKMINFLNNLIVN